MITLVAVGVGVATALILFRVFFDNLGDFFECVRFWIMPDITSAFRGEWHDDQWSELKLFLYLALCVGSGFSTHYGLHKLHV